MNIRKFLDWIIECDRVIKYVSIIEKKMTKTCLVQARERKDNLLCHGYICEVDNSEKGSFLLITNNIYLNGIKVDRKEINPSTNITPSFKG